MASGRVVVSGERQAVQHPQGGVAEAVLVHEGQTVQNGQVLVQLRTQDIEAELSSTELRLAALWAARERLHAQMLGQTHFAIPSDFDAIRPLQRQAANYLFDVETQRLHADQAATQMSENALVQQVSQAQESIESTRVRRTSLATQIDLINSELAETQSLADRGYAPITKVRALKREAARLIGEYETLKTDESRYQHQILEVRARKASIWKDRTETLAKESQSVEAEIARLEPTLPALRLRRDMAGIKSPASGKVVGLTLFTNGGVVPAGQTLMEIVPDNQPLLIEADLSPEDVESLHTGQRVEVRFTSYQDRRLASVKGEIITVSADALPDNRTGKSYFKIKVAINPVRITEVLGQVGTQRPIRAGMPVEVMIPIKSRTAFEYITQPISRAFWKSFHEH